MTPSRSRCLPLLLLLVVTLVPLHPGHVPAASAEPQASPRSIPWGVEWGRGEAPEDLAGILDAAGVERRARIDEERRLPVRAVYLPAGYTGIQAQVDRIISLVERTELNAVVVDFKSDNGDLIYPSSVPLAAQVSGRPMVQDLAAFVRQFTDRGIKVIARIVVFKDSRVPVHRPEWALATEGGTPWRDGIGSMWVDPRSKDMWDYIVDVSIEAALAGAWEIQYDYVRFPSDGRLGAIVYPYRDDRLRREVIRDFLAYAYERLEPFEVVVSADVFGLVPTDAGDMGIGQQWEMLAEVIDVLSPMTYPSHYGAMNYGLPNPNAEPYRTVLGSMVDGTRRAGIDVVTIRPWLQDFSWGYPPYGPAEVRAQIQAVYDAGSTGWMLWNSGGRFTEGALERAGQAP